MHWIIFFHTNKIPYEVYKLHKGDSIILSDTNFQYLTIILNGAVTLMKIISNEEIIPLAILSKNEIIDSKNAENSYYRLIALSTTYVIKTKSISLSWKQDNILGQLNISKFYQKTVKQYEEMLIVSNQKNTKKRIILFILFLFLKFGKIKQHRLIISFNILKQNIATMTNTKNSTVSKILEKVQIKSKNKISTMSIKNHSLHRIDI